MTLSVVIVIASDTLGGPGHVRHLQRCLLALGEQTGVSAPEIIVPHLKGVEGIETLAGLFPGTRFVAVDDLTRCGRDGMPGREHHDELRSRGLSVASGEIVALLEDHEYPGPEWATQIVSAHKSGYAAIGGAVENSIDRAINWAVYFSDFGQYQRPLAAGPSAIATDVNVSYKRTALDDIQSVWRRRFHERLVHAALLARGARLALCPAIVVYQHRVGLRLMEALRERFVWGRSYAASRALPWGLARRLAYTVLATALPPVLVFRMGRTVWRKRRCRRAFLRALPATIVVVLAWSMGEMVGYLTSRPSERVSPRRQVRDA